VSIIDVVPFASIDVSRFSDQPSGYAELRSGPGAVRDGDPNTAWNVPDDGSGGASITLDWSSRGVPPFAIDELHVAMDPPDAPLTIETGVDLVSLAPASAHVAIGADTAITLDRAPALRVLRVRFPSGTKVASIAALAAPGGSVQVNVNATCDANGVHLFFVSDAALGVEVTRDLANGAKLVIDRRRLDGSTITDATVRFDARPAMYSYAVFAIGSDEPAAHVEVTCEGPSLARPPAGAMHAVVEGFYGRPWTWAERAKIVRAMAALGLDTYVYAPKDEPMHRDEWRALYDDADIARFKDLASLASALGVDFVYGIAPGQDVDPSSQADVDALVAKVADMATRADIRDAALLMDDLDASVHPHSTALGQSHAALATTLLASMTARDAASRLLFVPTVYSGTASSLAKSDSDYVAALAQLPANVPIAWTGPGVFAQDLSLADGAAFVALAGRGAKDLWIWDNYPANDIVVFRRLYARAITGRESLLPGSAGLASNPMQHALASIPALASYAELAMDPNAYAAARAAGAPLASADLALMLADGDAPPRALSDFFAELVHHDTIWPNDLASPELTNAIAAYRAADMPGSDRRAAALDLATRLARLAVADVDLRRDLDDPSLSDEIDAYARVTSGAAHAALGAMTSDRARLLGDATSAEAAGDRAACAWASLNPPAWTTIQSALAPLVPAPSPVCDDARSPLDTSEAPLVASANEPMSQPFVDLQSEQGASWSIVGPSGVSITDDGVLSWTPQKLGRYRIVVMRSGDAGVAARAIEIVVIDAEPSAPRDDSGCALATSKSDAPSFAIVVIAAAMLARRRQLAGSTSGDSAKR
jgi:hypothetical protein